MIRNVVATDLSKPSVPHLRKEGARFHVLSWDTFGAHCSEPQCEENFARAERIRIHRRPHP